MSTADSLSADSAPLFHQGNRFLSSPTVSLQRSRKKLRLRVQITCPWWATQTFPPWHRTGLQHFYQYVFDQVRLQLASGAFLLTEIYSDCVRIPLDRLKRASPYTMHRRSLSPPFRCTSPSAPSLSTSAKPASAPVTHHVTFFPSSCSLSKPTAPPFHHTPDDTPLMLEARFRRRHPSDRDPVMSPPDLLSSEEGSLELSVGPSPSQSQGQADSGRGSETDVYEGSSGEPASLQGSSQLAQEDLEGSSWATAVALAWLEHRCAGYFMEWELVAAKADFWLRCQELPEGVEVAGLKGAARQLFLLLRHWDENIKLNMLCYNPNNMWTNHLCREGAILRKSKLLTSKQQPQDEFAPECYSIITSLISCSRCAQLYLLLSTSLISLLSHIYHRPSGLLWCKQNYAITKMPWLSECLWCDIFLQNL